MYPSYPEHDLFVMVEIVYKKLLILAINNIFILQAEKKEVKKCYGMSH